MSRLTGWTAALAAAGTDAVVLDLPDRPSLVEVEAELGPGRQAWMPEASTPTVGWTFDRPGERIRVSGDLTRDQHLERVWVGYGLAD